MFFYAGIKALILLSGLLRIDFTQQDIGFEEHFYCFGARKHDFRDDEKRFDFAQRDSSF